MSAEATPGGFDQNMKTEPDTQIHISAKAVSLFGKKNEHETELLNMKQS